MKKIIIIFSIILGSVNYSCRKEVQAPDCPSNELINHSDYRRFMMGFSTWAYALEVNAVTGTYSFIESHSEIYSEHIDNKIPWDSWINGTPLPTEFVSEIAGRKSRKLANKKLSLSVSLLNINRDDLATDFNDSLPLYNQLNDQHIIEAYIAHLQYFIEQLNPDFLIVGIEVNELLLHSVEKWAEYKLMMAEVRHKIELLYPELPLSESITLHSLFSAYKSGNQSYVNETLDYVNRLEFISISFYPFFNGLKNHNEFQEAFDFLHSRVTKPLAFVETGQLSEGLLIENMNLNISGDECTQKQYLETLCLNAFDKEYLYIIWWTHRDYDRLLDYFPEELKDLGRIWISNGLINEDGREKAAFNTWKKVRSNQYSGID